jgi:hypothetical protein
VARAAFPEVDDALTVSPLTGERILTARPVATAPPTPRRDHPMSSEPLTTTPAAAVTESAASAVESAEKGLLIAVLLMVLLGTVAMIFMN